MKRISQIRFDNVSFSYGTNKEVLNNISFTLGENERKIALVGKNGSGKSSIIKLLLGFYRDYKGEICINNNELRDLSRGL